jgi:hypothetical protein
MKVAHTVQHYATLLRGEHQQRAHLLVGRLRLKGQGAHEVEEARQRRGPPGEEGLCAHRHLFRVDALGGRKGGE